MDRLETTIEQKMINLTKYLNDCCEAYYNKAEPLISDKEYDELYSQLQKLERDYPANARHDSPTKRIGGVVKDALVKHKQTMYSLDNTYSFEELIDWINKLKESKVDVDEDSVLHGSLKLDGIALELVYNESKLSKIVTRGDGKVGTDITHLSKYLNFITTPITVENFNDSVYGEAVLSKDDFNLINNIRELEGLKPYKTPRNAVAGLLNLKTVSNIDVSTLKLIRFKAYGSTSKKYNHNDLMLLELKACGFDVPPSGITTIGETIAQPEISNLKVFYDKYDNLKETYDFPADGIVVRLNEFELCDQLGYTQRAPRFARAFKFESNVKSTTILDIEYQVGRTGIVTPVAIVDPITLNSVTINKVSLFNDQFIQSNGIMCGHEVSIRLSGMTVAQIFGVVRFTSNSVPFIPIKNCPSCGSKLVVISPSKKVCKSNACIGTHAAKIKHFLKKNKAVNTGLNSSIVKHLIKDKKIENLSTLFKLTESDLQKYCSEKVTYKILNSLEELKKRLTFKDILLSVSIEYITSNAAKAIVTEYKTIDNFIKSNPSVKDIFKLKHVTESIPLCLFEYLENGGKEELMYFSKLLK